MKAFLFALLIPIHFAAAGDPAAGNVRTAEPVLRPSPEATEAVPAAKVPKNKKWKKVKKPTSVNEVPPAPLPK
jgi:hypothetical protein